MARGAAGDAVAQSIGGQVRTCLASGKRGLTIPAASEIANPQEDTLLPDTVTELDQFGISLREVALDGGFNVGPTCRALERSAPARTFMRAASNPARGERSGASPATVPGPRAESATSNAATGYAAPG